jgi:hypothetical protein
MARQTLSFEGLNPSRIKDPDVREITEAIVRQVQDLAESTAEENMLPGGIQFGEFEDGKLTGAIKARYAQVEIVAGSDGTVEKHFRHKLGKVPSGFKVISRNVNQNDPYGDPDDWTDETMILTFNQDASTRGKWRLMIF